MILFFARKRSATCSSDDKLTTGSVGMLVQFGFSVEWDGITSKVAVFRAGSVSVDVLLTDGSCTVPPEVLATPGDTLTIGVYGTGPAGEIVIPTVYADAGRILRGAEPSGIEPTPQTASLVEQLLAAAQSARDAAAEAERLAQSVRDDADEGDFDGADGKSAYAIAVENGFIGTEAEWLQSLHGEDATVDATLSHAGEAADAAETGKVKKKADYALRFAETLNNGGGIPLDAEWLSGDIGGSRPYRVHSKRAVNTEQKVLQAAAGYRFYLRIYSSGSYSDSSWYGPNYSSRKTYTLPKGADYILVISTSPEDTSVTADPEVYGAQVTIQNNIGSGGGGGGSSVEPYTINPAALGTASPGSSDKYARGDHVHPKPSASDIGAAEVLWCTYGTTTSAEVEAAYQAGKIVLVEKDFNVFRLAARISATYHVFTVTTSAGTGTVVLNNDAWSTSSKNIPSASNSTPQALGTAAAGSSSDFSRADHVHQKPTASDIGAYAFPSGGIPKTDLASAVQTSLGKADTALQSVPSTYRTAAAQDVIDAGKADKVTEVTNTSTGDVTLQLDPGKIYHFTGAISSLTLTLATPASGQLAQYHFDFDSGSTAATISISGVTWPGGSFTPEASTHYEVDILNSFGLYIGWEVTS